MIDVHHGHLDPGTRTEIAGVEVQHLHLMIPQQVCPIIGNHAGRAASSRADNHLSEAIVVDVLNGDVGTVAQFLFKGEEVGDQLADMLRGNRVTVVNAGRGVRRRFPQRRPNREHDRR